MNTYGPLFDTMRPKLRQCYDPLCELHNAQPQIPKAGEADTGQQLKEKGIKQVSEHNENWMKRCLILIVPYIYHKSEALLYFTGEDIRVYLEKWGLKPQHPNAWGALINTLIKRKIIVPTGEHRKMRDSRSHARSTPVYKAK